MRQWKQKIVKSVGVIALIHMLVFGVQGVLLYRYWNHIDEAVQQKEEVAAVHGGGSISVLTEHVQPIEEQSSQVSQEGIAKNTQKLNDGEMAK